MHSTAPKRSPPCLISREEPGVRRDCSDVIVRLLAGRPVVEGINLKIRRGEALALVGRSGSGKTTLARLIGGSLTAWTAPLT